MGEFGQVFEFDVFMVATLLLLVLVALGVVIGLRRTRR